MLTQGPPPDPKCKLNISSFLTLPHLSDCLACTRNSVGMGWVAASYQGSGGGWLLHIRVWVGGQEVGIIS